MLDDESFDDESRFLLKRERLDDDAHPVDAATQQRLEALLEAAGALRTVNSSSKLIRVSYPCFLRVYVFLIPGIGKFSTSDGKVLGDPEVLRRLTSSVSCALDEAAAALTRMRGDPQGDGAAVLPSAAALLER